MERMPGLAISDAAAECERMGSSCAGIDVKVVDMYPQLAEKANNGNEVWPCKGISTQGSQISEFVLFKRTDHNNRFSGLGTSGDETGASRELPGVTEEEQPQTFSFLDISGANEDIIEERDRRYPDLL